MENTTIKCTAGYLMPRGTAVSVVDHAYRVQQAKRQRHIAAVRTARVPALIVDFPYPLSAVTCELRT